MTGQRFLIVRLAGIGDVVMASTVVARIRSEHPGSHITWLCGNVAAPIVRLFDVDDVITVNEGALLRGGPASRARALLGLWRRLATRRFDRVLLLHVDSRYRAVLAPLVGTRVTMLNRRRHGEMNPVPGRFLGDEYSRLLDDPGHTGPIARRYPVADLRPRLPAAERGGERRRIALIAGGARNVLRENPLRRWPVEHYVRVADALIAAGHEVALVGDANDAWLRPHFSSRPVTDLLGALDLVETASLLASCDLVISHDTGPMHLARAVRAPLIALFGPTMPAQFVAPDDTTTVLWGGAHLACRPCYDGREFAACRENICMSSIEPDEVARTALARLA